MQLSLCLAVFRRGSARARQTHAPLLCACSMLLLLLLSAPAAFADLLHMKSGAVIEVEEVWETPDGVWYRRGGVTELVSRDRVSRIERAAATKEPAAAAKERASAKSAGMAAAVTAAADATTATPEQVVWIHLVGGARMQADEATETADGVWYRRGNLSALLEKERVERIERAGSVGADAASARAPRAYQWTTGSLRLDAIIRDGASRHGVDPYLVFCVMEHESHFRSRAVSPAGARGLMQLMPGTARRFGVRNVFDPAQNVNAGVRYLKELTNMFDGNLDLVLASYNAGEGAVIRYGQRVPPYAETQNYVRRIGARYGSGVEPTAKVRAGARP